MSLKENEKFENFKDTYNGIIRKSIKLVTDQFDITELSNMDDDAKEMFGLLTDTLKLSSQALDLYEDQMNDIKFICEVCEKQERDILNLQNMVRDLLRSIDKMDIKIDKVETKIDKINN